MKKIVLYSLYAVALLTLLYFDKVLSIVMSVIGHVTAPIKCSGILLFGVGIAIIILIESLRPQKHQKPYRKPQSSDVHPLYSDQPTNNDAYGRNTSAQLLISKIFSTFNAEKVKGAEGSLVININEAYGYGKTSFLKIMESELQSSHSGEYYLINYRPWLCDSEKAIIRELFTLLSNSLGVAGIRDDIQEYLYLLLLQTEQIAPSEIKPFYAILPRKLKSKTLQELHDDIKDKLKEIEHPIIITIDDVDRLQKKELTAVLKLIRDTADFPNIFYIVAAENAHLHQMLSRIGVQHPDIYLKKFFNLDFLLPAHESVPTKILIKELKNILQTYKYPSQEIDNYFILLAQLSHLDIIFCNMREVYRFLNTYTVSLDLLKIHNNLSLINPYELFCLTIIKHLHVDVYKILRDRNDEFLYVIHHGHDTLFNLKEDINLEKILRNKDMMRRIDKNNFEVVSKEEQKKKQKEEESRSLNDVIKLKHITHDKLIFYMLDHLFGNSSNNDERSIRRSNSYFLYFSGQIKSDKQSTAEAIDIIKMPHLSYEKKVDSLFKEGKGFAFQNNFTYAYAKSGICKEEAMKKYYTLLKTQYYHNHDKNHLTSTPFEEYINRYPDSYMAFLGELYGRYIIDRHQININKIQDTLKLYCQTESDLNMLALAFSIFSSQINGFCFGRDFIEPMIALISNRIIEEQMKTIPVLEIPLATFATIKLLKEEFSTSDKWQEKFTAFLSHDEARCKQWLASMVDIYDNGNVNWNYHRHEAILGEYSNSGEELLNILEQKFPDCSEAIEDLKRLQHYSSLSGQESMGGTFIQMVREVQQKSTHID